MVIEDLLNKLMRCFISSINHKLKLNAMKIQVKIFTSVEECILLGSNHFGTFASFKSLVFLIDPLTKRVIRQVDVHDPMLDSLA